MPPAPSRYDNTRSFNEPLSLLLGGHAGRPEPKSDLILCHVCIAKELQVIPEKNLPDLYRTQKEEEEEE